MNFQHKTLIRLSGAIWLIMGIFLMRKGILFLMSALREPNDYLLSTLKGWLGTAENGVLMLIVLALAIGWMKGKTALKRSALRVINRIQSLPNPLELHRIYPWPFYLVVGCMMGLSVSMTTFGVPSDIRGTVLTTVGTALIHGSIFYFKA